MTARRRYLTWRRWLRGLRRRRARRAAALVALAAAVGCASPALPEQPAPTATTTAVTVSAAPSLVSPVPTAPASASAPAGDARAILAQLAVNDRPAPGGYRRELFPHWEDLDGNGCDAREDALIAATLQPVASAGCKAAAGRWHSDYDGVETSDPSELDIDHIVPLAEAWRSGAAAWETDQRARFANDPVNLWAVSASSNRSKGDQDPAEWRPPRSEVWCTYATRWVSVKVTYRLATDSAERDALGQMLDTCGPGGRADEPEDA